MARIFLSFSSYTFFLFFVFLRSSHALRQVVIPCPDLLPPVPPLPSNSAIPSPSSNLTLSQYPTDSGRLADLALSSYLAFIITPEDTTHLNQSLVCTATLITSTALLTTSACAISKQSVVHLGSVYPPSIHVRNVSSWQFVIPSNVSNSNSTLTNYALLIVQLDSPAPEWMRVMPLVTNFSQPILRHPVRLASYSSSSSFNPSSSLSSQPVLRYVDGIVQSSQDCLAIFNDSNLNHYQATTNVNLNYSDTFCVTISPCPLCAAQLGAPVFLPDVAGAPLLLGVTSPLLSNTSTIPLSSSYSSCPASLQSNSQQIQTNPYAFYSIHVATIVNQFPAFAKPTLQPSLSPTVSPFPSTSMVAQAHSKRLVHSRLFVAMAVTILLAVSCLALTFYHISCKTDHPNRSSQRSVPFHPTHMSNSLFRGSRNDILHPNLQTDAAYPHKHSPCWSRDAPPELGNTSKNLSNDRFGHPQSKGTPPANGEDTRNVLVSNWLRATAQKDVDEEGTTQRNGVTPSVTDARDERETTVSVPLESGRTRVHAQGDDDGEGPPLGHTGHRHGQGQSLDTRRRFVIDWLGTTSP